MINKILFLTVVLELSNNMNNDMNSLMNDNIFDCNYAILLLVPYVFVLLKNVSFFSFWAGDKFKEKMGIIAWYFWLLCQYDSIT